MFLQSQDSTPLVLVYLGSVDVVPDHVPGL